MRKSKLMITSHAMSLIIRQPDSIFLDNDRDRTSFDHIHTAATSGTSVLFGGESWWSLALRTSSYEPAVQHAIHALGLLMSASTVQQKGNSEPTAWTLLRYNKAIASFNEGLIYPDQKEQTAVVLSLIFIYIELLCNNADLALHHLRGGIRIAANAGSSNKIAPCLSHALVRLQTQARAHSSPSSDFNRSTLDVELADLNRPITVFRDITEARRAIDDISVSLFGILRHFKIATRSSRVMDSFAPTEFDIATEKLLSLGARLSEWRLAFDHYLALCTERGCASGDVAIDLLEVQYEARFIILSTVFETDEWCYDAFATRFSRITALVEKILDAHTFRDPSSITVEAGLISVLYFVGMKCRLARVRMKVIQLLSRCPSQEGFWHRDSALHFIRWKLAVENNNGAEDVELTKSPRVHTERVEVAVVEGRNVITRKYKIGHDSTEHTEEWSDLDCSDLVAGMADMI